MVVYVDLADDLARAFARQHVIYYRATDDAVIIVRILHGRMDARRALGDQ
ncbi:MAG: type II toxin-antitoxin system RelE/ParE family toxin [Chloroflexia bacterium]